MDLLGRAQQVSHFAAQIMSIDPPHVFGVHGDWGAGKTSFLFMLRWVLSGECPDHDPDVKEIAGLVKAKHADAAAVIWFEAWKYQFEEAPIVALLHEIRAQLPRFSKFREQVKKLGAVISESALVGIEDYTKKIGVQASKIREVGERWEREHLAVQLPADAIRAHLDRALSMLIGREEERTRRIVVLIDDLDRCEPEAAFRLLEGIKIYLNLPSCVFVIGMDQRIIEEVIAAHAPGRHPSEADDAGVRHERLAELRARASEYLEKLCPDVHHLPHVGRVGTILKHWLPTDGHLSPDARDAIGDLIETYACLPANPRKIKGFANTLGRLAANLPPMNQVARNANGRISLSFGGDGRALGFLIVVTYLYHFHARLYRILESQPGFYEVLLNWSLGLDIEHPELQSVQKGWRIGSSAADAQNLYPDPSRGHILRVQRLIAALGTLENEAEITRFTRLPTP